jgi:uncharacterized protein YlxW (UPF0749 family)
MAAFADNGGLRPPQEPLGEMLVNRGLITREQLIDALAQQKASGEPLGAIVVARGFANPSTIAQALATQHGGLLKTEYGFATGFGAGGVSAPINVGEPPVSSARITSKNGIAALSVVEAPAVTEVKPVEATEAEREEADRDAVREEISLASAETTRLTEANERLVAARGELEHRLAQEKQRASALESKIAELESAEPSEDDGRIAELEEALEGFRSSCEQWQAAVGQRDEAIAERDAALESLRAEVEKLKEEKAGMETELASVADLREAAAASESMREELEQLRAKLAETEAELEKRNELLVNPWATAKAHLLFFKGADGYELVERSGPPPTPGTHVGVAGAGDQVVTRIAASPVPGRDLPCAYLVG